MKNFNELGLDQNFQKIFNELGFDETTEIQEKVIPLAVAGKDLIAKSATGSGKTLAFGFPVIEKLKVKNGLQALILTPTRDLAEQISKSLKLFSKYKPLKIATIYGGVALSPQIEDLEKAEIVVGTPGRILDHMSRGTINLSKIKILVLDEADRMLDMGFIHDVTNIIYPLPKNRQSLLFSATISDDIRRIAGKYMINPAEVSAESYVDASKLKQVFYDVPSRDKFSLLVHLLKKEDSKLVMVFCNTKRTADSVGNNLRQNGFDALALHGDLSQNQRKRVLEHFHKSEKFILVCTDIASRGLDIKNVSHIYNYDTSKISTDYIHRIGRTARAGTEGKAITLLSDRDYDNFRKVKNNSSLYIEQVKLPEFEKVAGISDDNRRGRWGRDREESGGRSFRPRGEGRESGSGRGYNRQREGEPRRPGEGRNRGFRKRPQRPGDARGGAGAGSRNHKRYERNQGRGNRR